MNGHPEGAGLEGDCANEDGQRHPPPTAFDRVGVVPLVIGLVECEEATDREEDDGDDEGVDVAVAPVAEGVLFAGLAGGGAATDKQKDLVAGIGHGVDGFGEHGGGAGEQVGGELEHGDAEVRDERGDDGPVPSTC